MGHKDSWGVTGTKQPCRNNWGDNGFAYIEMPEDNNKDSPGVCYMYFVSCWPVASVQCYEWLDCPPRAL